MEVELHEIVGRDVVDVLANFDRLCFRPDLWQTLNGTSKT